MKALACFFLCLPFTASAQKFGIKAGLNVWELGSRNSSISFHGGMFMSFRIAENMAVVPELNYSVVSPGDETLRYLQVPVLVNFYEYKWLFLQLGIQYGRMLSADITINNQTISTTSVRNKNDLALVAGLGAEFGKFVVNVRYNWGVMNVIPNQDFATISIAQASFGLVLN